MLKTRSLLIPAKQQRETIEIGTDTHWGGKLNSIYIYTYTHSRDALGIRRCSSKPALQQMRILFNLLNVNFSSTAAARSSAGHQGTGECFCPELCKGLPPSSPSSLPHTHTIAPSDHPSVSLLDDTQRVTFPSRLSYNKEDVKHSAENARGRKMREDIAKAPCNFSCRLGCCAKSQDTSEALAPGLHAATRGLLFHRPARSHIHEPCKVAKERVWRQCQQ